MKLIKMNGIRLSDRQVQVSQSYIDGSYMKPDHLYRLLSVNRINILFLSINFFDRKKNITCCIEPDKLIQTKNYINNRSETNDKVSYRPDTGTLSVYPHKFSLKSIGYIFYVLGREKYQFYHMASSTSMLTFVVDFHHLENIAACLERYIDLPESHTPFRQRFDHDDIVMTLKNVPETNAAYVESKVKTYGIQTRSDLSLCRLNVPSDKLVDWGKQIQNLENLGMCFYFASARLASEHHFKLSLLISVLDSRNQDKRHHMIASAFSKKQSESLTIQSDVGLVFLQGPHFGDRYGIADLAFTALIKNSIPIVLAGCVGATVYIVLPKDMISKAESILFEIFETS